MKHACTAMKKGKDDESRAHWKIRTVGKRLLVLLPPVNALYCFFRARTNGFERRVLTNFEEPMFFFAPPVRVETSQWLGGWDKEGRYEAPLVKEFFQSLNRDSACMRALYEDG